MFLGGLKAQRAEHGPSWQELERLSQESDDLVDDVNDFIRDHFPEINAQTVATTVDPKDRPEPRAPTPVAANTTAPSAPTPVAASTTAPSAPERAERKPPIGVMGALVESMDTVKSAWESYEDAYEDTKNTPYEGRGFERYFSHGIEDRSNLRLRKFEERNFDNKYYDYHYLEHHLRENDDERLADRMRSEERVSEARVDDRARLDRETSMDEERRIDLETERRYDDRVNRDDDY